MTHRVEWDTGYIVFEGTRDACIEFILEHPYPSELNLVNMVSGRAESWVG